MAYQDSANIPDLLVNSLRLVFVRDDINLVSVFGNG